MFSHVHYPSWVVWRIPRGASMQMVVVCCKFSFIISVWWSICHLSHFSSVMFSPQCMHPFVVCAIQGSKFLDCNICLLCSYHILVRSYISISRSNTITFSSWWGHAVRRAATSSLGKILWNFMPMGHGSQDMGIFHCLGHFNHYPILFNWNSWRICANVLFSGLCVLQSNASFSIWSFPQFMGGFSWPEGDIKKTFCSPASGRRRQSEWHCVKSGRLTLNWLSVHCLCFEE